MHGAIPPVSKQLYGEVITAATLQLFSVSRIKYCTMLTGLNTAADLCHELTSVAAVLRGGSKGKFTEI